MYISNIDTHTPRHIYPCHDATLKPVSNGSASSKNNPQNLKNSDNFIKVVIFVKSICWVIK